MDNIEYEILTLIQQHNDKNKPITYQDVISILISESISMKDIVKSVNKLIDENFLICQGNERLHMFGPLLLTNRGTKIYKKEYIFRNPKPPGWLKRSINFISRPTKWLIVTIIGTCIILILTDLWPCIKSIFYNAINTA